MVLHENVERGKAVDFLVNRMGQKCRLERGETLLQLLKLVQACDLSTIWVDGCDRSGKQKIRTVCPVFVPETCDISHNITSTC
jgi:hypothetical protein